MTWDVSTDTVEVEIDMATETPIAADWGEIGGDIDKQADLKNRLDAKLSEAPTDGKTYGRKNGAWAEVTGGGTGDHTQLTNRDAANQHPISAIQGLQAALDGKADDADIPTKTSDLTNDSGFLTEETLPNVGTVTGNNQSENLGTVGIKGAFGFNSEDGYVKHRTISDAELLARNISPSMPAKASAITLGILDKAVKASLADGMSGNVWTDTDKQRASARMGYIREHQSLAAYRTAAEQDAIHDATKQDTLTTAQLAAANSGITSADKTKLDGIAAGAEVNVNADWNAVSGDAQILNKPTIPSLEPYRTAADQDVIDATKADATALTAEVTARQTADTTEATARSTQDTILRKRIVNLEANGLGKLRRIDTDNTTAYAKTVPYGAMPYATVDKVGGRTIVWNQLCSGNAGTVTRNGITYTKLGNCTWNISGTIADSTGAPSSCNVLTHKEIAGHKYLITWKGDYTPTANKLIFYGQGSNCTLVDSKSKIYTAQATQTYYSGFFIYSTCTNTFDVDVSIQLFDLTQMFGAGNEPATVEAFRAMFPNDYYAYDAGSLLNADVVNVKSVDSDNVTLANLPISQDVRDLCPLYGASAGTAYNYIDMDARIYHQLVTSRAYQSGDENNATVTTDGTTTYYTLATPIEVDLSSVLSDDNLLEVEAGGTLTFENSHGDGYRIPVPSSEDFVIDITDALAEEQYAELY